MKKRKYICLVLLLCSLLFSLAGCGGREEENVGEPGSAGQSGPAEQNSVSKDNAEQKEKGDAEAYYDIVTDTEDFFDFQSLDWGQGMGIERKVLRTWFLGMQFYQEEPAQLWGVLESNPVTMKVYLCMGDGSAKLLFSGLPQDYGYRSWFLDQEGNAYLLSHGKVMKLDTDGKVLYDRELDITDTKTICQLPDGSIYLLASENGPYKLATLDPVSGSVSIVDELGWSRSPQAVGVAEDGLLFMDGAGFWKLDPKDKTQSAFLLFEGTTYYEDSDKEAIKAIRAEDGGSVQILRTGQTVRKDNLTLSQGYGKVETLKMANAAGEKIPIVIRGLKFNFSWTKEQVVRFNQSQSDYYVVLDECPEGSDADDFVRRTGVEIATGKGPDILCGGQLMEDYIYGMIQKGIFEDLKPYMDKSGIREEDYFPLAFSSWREGEKIYGINYKVDLDGYWIEEAVLGSRKEPDIGTLMDALLVYGEDAFYMYFRDSQFLLRMFLEGSENLWGMVDWEKGTCDFGGELFAKILQVSKRYGYDERFHYPAIAEERLCGSIVFFDSPREQEKDKIVTSGVLFDDGCHAGVRSTGFTMAVNANSAHKEGAWEFLKFLLGEEAQSALDENHLPVLKQAFDEMTAEALSQGNDKYHSISGPRGTFVNGEWIMGIERTVEDLSEEKVAALKATIEDARPYPIRTNPILDIIQEEAAYYFDGTKDIDEVRRIIENRVRLYMEENG